MIDNKEKTLIRKIGLAVFHDGKILMARSIKNSDVFYIPGGKIEVGETDVECLERETKEELSAEIDKTQTRFLAEFQEIAHNRPDVLVNLKLYETRLLSDPQPDSEIEELRYFDSSIDSKHIDLLGSKIFAWLKNNNYIS